MSKSVMWDETERRLVFHRPQFVWFSSSKKPGKGKKHISSLSVEQLLKTRIAIRAIPSVQRRQRRAEEIYSWQDECHACRLDEFERDEFHDPSYTRLRKDPPIIDFVATYKIDAEPAIPKLQAAVTVRKPPTCNQCPHPGRRCGFSNYEVVTIAPPSRPTPPRRSSSLSKDSRVIEVITHPSAPLQTFTLSPQDGLFFQHLLVGSLSKIDYFSGTGLWSLVLQTSYTEPCIRHLILGTSMMHQTRNIRNDSRAVVVQQSALRHYVQAIRLLNELLNSLDGEAGSEIWELTLLATFLFTSFEVFRRNEERAEWWMQSGKMLLKHAKSPTSDMKGDFKDVGTALNMLELNLKVKRMKTLKRQDRKLGTHAGRLRKQRRLSMMF
ncbi:hypothetical protein B0J14DRAFT_306669 [Halenospora varia]|nr:hypothetical protein B0J14DRAFT_306669 [Halenospora varia]